jgi:acyl-CoA thioester hydrolase
MGTRPHVGGRRSETGFGKIQNWRDFMQEFLFYHPIVIRYGDLDAQRHVNNARYFTFLEEARVQYLKNLGLWDGTDFDEIGIILLETTCTFKAPIRYEHKVRAGVKMIKLGNKSMELLHSLEDAETGDTFATGRSILVAYDYAAETSIPVPDHWRKTLLTYDGK